MRSIMLVAVVLLTVGCAQGLSGGVMVVLAMVAGLAMACSQRVQARIEPEPSAAPPLEATADESAVPRPEVADVAPEPAIAAPAAPPEIVEPPSEPIADAPPGSSAFDRRVHAAVERLPVEQRARIRQNIRVAVAANGGGEGFERYCKVVLPRIAAMRAPPRWVRECRIVFAEQGDTEEGLR